MSILVRPPKRKLDEIEGLEQNNRLSYSSHNQYAASNTYLLSDSDSGRDAGHPVINSYPLAEPSEATGESALRELSSNRASPVSFDGPFQAQRKFAPNASIVLVGIRGTGKSSIAVILAATSGRRLIDADRYFQQVTGRSRAIFKKERGIAEYRQQEARVMESMLSEHKEGWVIACGPGSMERSGQKFLREYAITHPVIHIIRDAESIQSYLQAWDTDKVNRFLELSGPIYRACSNLEFFNVSETGHGDSTLGKSGHHHSQLELEVDQRSQTFTPFLTLKRLQRDFVRFIAAATGNATDLSNQHAWFPLSTQPVEARTFTYAVTVPISTLFARDLNIEDLESTADAFELKVDVTDNPSSRLGLDSALADKISQTVAIVRRNIVVPLIYHVESVVGQINSATPRSEPTRRSPAAYLNLMQHGLRLAFGFITVDLSYDDGVLSQIIASRGSSKVIGHYASIQPLERGWDDPIYLEMYERAKQLGCDVVRLTQPAASMDDNHAVQRFRDHIKALPGPQLPLIAYNSGPLGRLSCCFNPILTPVTNQSLMSEPQAKNLPCITLREAQEALYASFALDPMQFFVFGANVTYSLSPAMHNAAYQACGMPHVYSLHQSPSLRGLNELVANPNFGGTSVSLPYKTESIPLLHSMSPHARAIGAVNTLIPIRDLEDTALTSEGSSLYLEKSRAGPIKGLHGDNTDWIVKQMRALSHRGWVALDGLDVLPEQGFAQFELFTGRRAPRRLMRTIVLQEYKAEEGQDDQNAIQSRLESLDGQPS
ncbi:hypothetical protein BBP40_003310 [Aspergillus hancockii]|nr:hypothetical protein BBP40_003310 [Aspergillus hancockii]